MSAFWGNLIGAYLLIGVVTYGLGAIAKARWIASGTMKPPGEKARRLQTIGVVLGVFLWPLALVMVPIWRWKSRRKAIKYMGFCEHRTALEPVCRACRFEVDVEQNLKNAISRAVVEGSSRADAKTELRRISTEEELGKRLAEIQRKAASLPDSPGKRKVDEDLADLQRQLDSFSGPPGEVGMFHSHYVCANCGAQRDGFPPDVDRNNKPLCPNCRTLP